MKRSGGKTLIGRFISKYKLELMFVFMYLFIASVTATALFQERPEMSYDKLVTSIESGEVEYVEILGASNMLNVGMTDGEVYKTLRFGTEDFVLSLAKLGVDDIRIKNTTTKDFFITLVTTLITFVILYGIARYLMASFKSMAIETGAKNLKDKVNVKFDDVAGLTEEKAELQYAITSLTNKAELEQYGVRPLRGILFTGRPGVGKTLLAKAVAGESGVNFLAYSGSDFSGSIAMLGVMRVKEMFREAQALAPCVVFIDEIDAIASKRSNSGQSIARDDNKTLNKLLELWDGVKDNQGVLIIGATNLKDNLDEAVLRPGRFDKILDIQAPKSKEDRVAVVDVHLKNKKLVEGLNAENISHFFYGMTGAEIEGSLNEAVIVSVQKGKKGIIDEDDLDEATMKQYTKGVAKGTHNEKDKKRVAVHEVGHVLLNQKNGNYVSKVSIQPYSGGFGGVTVIDADKSGLEGLSTRKQFRSRLEVLLAGMVAEEVVLGDYSEGNSGDIEQATKLVYTMFARLGMGSTLLSTDVLDKSGVPDTNKQKIYDEMNTFMSTVRVDVTEYLKKEEVRKKMDSMTAELLDKETIHGVGFEYTTKNT